MSARFWDLMRHLEGCVVRNSATGLHWRGGWVGRAAGGWCGAMWQDAWD